MQISEQHSHIYSLFSVTLKLILSQQVAHPCHLVKLWLYFVIQCLCRAEFCSFQHSRNLYGADAGLTEMVPNGNAIKLDFNWKCRKGLLHKSLLNQWRHSLNTMGGNPCFPCSPVSEHRCGCSAGRAQPRPRFLCTCSFLQRTMTGISAGQVIPTGHAEKPFPQAEMGRTSQKSLSPAAAGLPQSSSGCAPALPQGLGDKHLHRDLFTYFTANNTDMRESQ